MQGALLAVNSCSGLVHYALLTSTFSLATSWFYFSLIRGIESDPVVIDARIFRSICTIRIL